MLTTNLVCDRCKQVFEPIRMAHGHTDLLYSRVIRRAMVKTPKGTESTNYITDALFDLCPQCENEFLDFMDMKTCMEMKKEEN